MVRANAPRVCPCAPRRTRDRRRRTAGARSRRPPRSTPWRRSPPPSARWSAPRTVTLLIADFSGRAVVRLTSAGLCRAPGATASSRPRPCRSRAPPTSSVLRTQQPTSTRSAGRRVIVPVTDRGDAIGLLEMTLPRLPQPDEVADICSAAHALAYVVIAARRHTDVFEWGQRSTPFALAAEIQRRLLPASYTCEAGQFTLAGWLEPASSVGGDTFDYTLDRDSLQVSITDAVGHQVAAALLATLLVGEPAQRAAQGPRPRRAGPVRQRLRWPRTPHRASSSPAAACGSTCAPAPARSSTPGTRSRCGCATAGWRRSSCASRRRSASLPGKRSTCRPSRSSPATGSSCSPTACRSATPPPSTSRRRWPHRGPAPARGRPRAGRRGAARHRRATCATTPRWSASTGTAGRRASGTASRAPTPTAPRPVPRH